MEKFAICDLTEFKVGLTSLGLPEAGTTASCRSLAVNSGDTSTAGTGQSLNELRSKSSAHRKQARECQHSSLLWGIYDSNLLRHSAGIRLEKASWALQ